MRVFANVTRPRNNAHGAAAVQRTAQHQGASVASDAPQTNKGDPLVGERNGFPAGTPCWVDVTTTELEGTKAFYATLFGWPEPFADGADKAERYAGVEEATNERMAEILAAALDQEEAAELGRLSAAALDSLKAAVPA
mgnify:CR=1 FL=1